AAVGAGVLVESRAKGAGKGMALIEAGRSAQVFSLPEDAPSAQYFAAILEQLTGTKLEVVSGEPAAGNRPAVLIGDVQTNAKIRQLAGANGSKLTPQGLLLATTSDGNRPVLLLAGGSRGATPWAIGELLNFQLAAGPNTARVPELNMNDNPTLPYRIFWNWDHSTNWVRGVPGEQEHGCANPYMKRSQDYLNDYRRVTDFMGEHKINGVIIWGFLRDNHGGVGTSKELVEHAWSRGVHVLPGIGSSHYGGFYYSGDNRFNVDTWLAENPVGLRFVDKKGKPMSNTICPSQPENQKWLRDGTAWMFTEFKHLGGANLENGDFMACQCDTCKRSRRKPENDPNYYYDMFITQLPIIETARKINPAAWMTYATYTGFNADELWKRTDKSLIRSAVPKFVSRFPEEAICQWTYTSMVEGWGRDPEAEVRKKWPKGLRPPTKHSIGLLHQGSQWHGSDVWWTKSSRQNATGQRYVDISELIRYTCTRCAEEGLEGLEIQGEVNDDSPANELNYLALEEFAWRPQRSMEDFIRYRLATIYGSYQDAQTFVRIVRSEERSLPALLKFMNVAGEISNNRHFNARQRRRWANLRAEVARRISLIA
ncbi:MAG: hypothetical protein AAB403_14935, partial [Planctomycetota bacterium]